MNKLFSLFVILTSILTAETLFEVKDASNNKVLDVSTDGLRILNMGDTLMVISSSEIKAVLDNSKGLSRSFSVTTSSSKGSENDLMRLTGDSTRFWISDTGSGFGVSSQSAAKEKSVATNFLKVSNANTEMREGVSGDRYTDFSPKNIFIGLKAGISTTIGVPFSYSGLYNLFIGNYAGESNTSGYFNTFTGYMSGAENIGGHHNSFYGYQSGMNNLTGNYNCAFGHEAGYYLSSGTNNIFMGYRAGHTTNNGTNNIFMGSDAGYFNATGDYNVAFGYQSGYNLTDGNSNINIGYQSGFNTTDGDNNIFVGYQAGYANTTGNNNQFMGYMSGQDNTTGSNSLFLGWQSGLNNISGYENLFVGNNAGSANTSGFGNVCLGTYAGQVFTTGNENVMIGRGAGCYASTSASNNVFIGSYSGYGNAANTGNVFLGYKVGYNNVGSNKLMIDNADSANVTTSLIFGDFASDVLRINGTLLVKNLQIADMGSSNLGLNGDVVPYLGSTGGYDLGNNTINEYWDDVVALDHITYSDRNTKDEIKTINHGLQDLLKLRPVSYRYKKEISPDNRIRLGLIAQEVEEVIPEAVVNDDIDYDPETGEKIVTKGQYKALNYDQLIPVLVKAVQEQQQIIEEMKKEIELLKKN